MVKAKPLLKAIALTRRYKIGDGSAAVVDDVSLEVQMGETVALVGASGSGKSTLLGLLAGLDTPSAGEVWMDGHRLDQMDEEALAAFRGKNLGFLFQSYRLLPGLSALENVMAPLELAGRQDAEEVARQWLAQVGLEARLGNRPGELSGGEQQRVALARAMAPGPRLLLADEPTGNLDSATGKAMADLLFNTAKKEKIALLLVTHDRKLAARAGRSLVMKDGRLSGGRERR